MAVVCWEVASLPASGSLNKKAPIYNCPSFFPGPAAPGIFVSALLWHIYRAPGNKAVVHAHANTNTRVYFTYFFHGEHITDGVHTCTSVAGRNHHAHKAKIGELHDLVMRETLVFIPFYNAGQAFVYRKIACCFLYHQVFFAKLEMHDQRF